MRIWDKIIASNVFGIASVLFDSTGKVVKLKVNDRDIVEDLGLNEKIVVGIVDTFADLPAASEHDAEVWLVKTTTGVIYVNRKVAGFYLSNGTSWTLITPFDIDGYQKIISSYTEGNIVSVDYFGQVVDSGLAASTDPDFLDNSDSKISTQKAIKSYIENNTLGSVDVSSGLVQNGREISTLYASAIADDVQSVAVGGAQPAPASEWKTKTLVQSLDTILFPDVYPTYTIPSMSMTAGQSGNKEIGQTISQTLSSLVNKNDAGAVYQVLFKRGSTTISTDNSPSATSISDIAPQFGYNDPNNPNYRYSSSYTDNFVVVSGTTSWTSSCSYSAGLAKKNNKGVDDDRAFAVRSTNAPQAASTTLAAASVTVTGLYPYFWGYSDTALSASEIATIIQSGAANKVLSSASGTIVISYNMPSDKFIWFAHVSSYTSKTKWYVTALNNGDIGPGQFIASPVLQNATSPDGFWSNVQFKIYISSYSSYLNSAIEFRNS